MYVTSSKRVIWQLLLFSLLLFRIEVIKLHIVQRHQWGLCYFVTTAIEQAVIPRPTTKSCLVDTYYIMHKDDMSLKVLKVMFYNWCSALAKIGLRKLITHVAGFPCHISLFYRERKQFHNQWMREHTVVDLLSVVNFLQVSSSNNVVCTGSLFNKFRQKREIRSIYIGRACYQASIQAPNHTKWDDRRKATQHPGLDTE